MGEATPTPDAAQRSKGPSTAFLSSVEVRDARQDARTDTAWQAALAASEKAHQSAGISAAKTIKMLYMLLAAAMLAVLVLTAMVLGSELNVTSKGVMVGGRE